MRKLFIFLLLGISMAGAAQLTVTPDTSALVMAQKIVGTGGTVTNAHLNCGASAAGSFTYSGNNLGLSQGIILTTGRATDAAGAGGGTYFCDVLNGNFYTDPDLTALSPAATNDVCLLEFDLVPTYNFINITFVFASEEYPSFVNSSYNDAIGFFLTGPNPGGGNYTDSNIAVIPGNIPVAINNINAGTNSSWFHDNYTSPNSDIAYDGYTIPINTFAPVNPGSIYHLKLAVADAGDEAYDSGVFIHDSLFTSSTGISDRIATLNALYPVPCSEHITVNSSFKNFTYQVFNVAGERVLAGNASASQWLIETGALTTGVYQILLISENGKKEKARFLKQ